MIFRKQKWIDYSYQLLEASVAKVVLAQPFQDVESNRGQEEDQWNEESREYLQLVADFMEKGYFIDVAARAVQQLWSDSLVTFCSWRIAWVCKFTTKIIFPMDAESSTDDKLVKLFCAFFSWFMSAQKQPTANGFWIGVKRFVSSFFPCLHFFHRKLHSSSF